MTCEQHEQLIRDLILAGEHLIFANALRSKNDAPYPSIMRDEALRQWERAKHAVQN